VRADGAKADGFPVIAQVPQMLPEGFLACSYVVAPCSGHGVLECESIQLSSVDYSCHKTSVLSRAAGKSSDGQTIFDSDEESLDSSNCSSAIVGDDARAILLELHAILLAHVRGLQSRLPTFDDAIKQLPVDMQGQASALFQNEAANPHFALVDIFLALNDALGMPPLSDEDEAFLAVAIVSAGVGELDDDDARRMYRTEMGRYLEAILRR